MTPEQEQVERVAELVAEAEARVERSGPTLAEARRTLQRLFGTDCVLTTGDAVWQQDEPR
jgi:hypothetical protein